MFFAWRWGVESFGKAFGISLLLVRIGVFVIPMAALIGKSLPIKQVVDGLITDLNSPESLNEFAQDLPGKDVLWITIVRRGFVLNDVNNALLLGLR